MRLRLTSALAIAFIAAVATVFLLLGFALSSYLKHGNEQRAVASFREQAQLAAVAAAPAVNGTSATDPAALAVQIGLETGTTATIFNLNGTPVADSEGAAGSLQASPLAPEVNAALNGETTSVKRDSPSTGQATWYVAAPIKNGTSVIGAVRLSVPSDHLVAGRAGEQAVIALFLVVAAGATLLAVALVTRVAAKPLVKIVAATQRVSLGDMSARAPEEGSGDFVALAIAFNEMADELQATFDTIELQRRRLDSIVEHLGDGIVIIDNEGKVLLMNRSAERLLGFLRDRAVGRSYAQVFRDYELVRAVREAQATGDSSSIPAERFIELGRPRRSVQTLAYPIPSDDVPLVLVVLRDITEFRRTEAVRRDFVANVSHDLRTPIASLKALVETLLDGALEDETVARDFLSRMQVEVDDLARLVEELLQLSRAEAGQVDLRVESGDLEEVAHRVAERMQAQASQKQIVVRVAAIPDLPNAMFDVDRIEQVLVNLVHNAIKFTPNQGQVSLRLAANEDEVIVSVQDSGPGLDPDDLDRVFERFYKADRSRSAAGSGLGLAIAKHLVQLHGGRIWAESDYGHGATFNFAVPRARAANLDPNESFQTSERAGNVSALD